MHDSKRRYSSLVQAHAPRRSASFSSSPSALSLHLVEARNALAFTGTCGKMLDGTGKNQGEPDARTRGGAEIERPRAHAHTIFDLPQYRRTNG